MQNQSVKKKKITTPEMENKESCDFKTEYCLKIPNTLVQCAPFKVKKLKT